MLDPEYAVSTVLKISIRSWNKSSLKSNHGYLYKNLKFKSVYVTGKFTSYLCYNPEGPYSISMRLLDFEFI
jgi:hypothetical protein